MEISPNSVLGVLYGLAAIGAFVIVERTLFIGQHGALFRRRRVHAMIANASSRHEVIRAANECPRSWDPRIHFIRQLGNESDITAQSRIVRRKLHEIFRFAPILKHFAELATGLGLLGTVVAIVMSPEFQQGSPALRAVLFGAMATTAIGLCIGLPVSVVYYSMYLEPRSEDLWREYAAIICVVAPELIDADRVLRTRIPVEMLSGTGSGDREVRRAPELVLQEEES